MFKIRWMLMDDIPYILKIENQIFEFPWDIGDFDYYMRSGAVGLIAEFEEQIVGYMFYDVLKTRMVILNLGVEPSKQRCGVGSFLVDKIKARLHPQHRFSIDAMVRETNLPAQLFLQKNGFKATGIRSMPYLKDGIEEEGYEFTFTGVEPSLEEPSNKLQGAR